MRRYWLELEAMTGNEVTIRGEPFHHIFDVCRQDIGHQFEILVGNGKAYLVEVVRVEKKQASCVIREERTLVTIPRPHLHLCLSLPRFSVMDAVIEKTVELGVYALHPFCSDFSFIKKKDEISENRMQRWQKIIRSATQQSGRGDIMLIEPPVYLEERLKSFNQNPDAVGLFCYEGEGQKDLKTWSGEIKSAPEEIWVFIGSEGGFSEKEIMRFQELNLPPVTLGAQVLRVETACVAILSVLKYQWDLFK